MLIAPRVGLAAESAPVTTRARYGHPGFERTVVSGERFRVALVQDIAKGWHTYWANPGDSGEPTRIEWASAGCVRRRYPVADAESNFRRSTRQLRLRGKGLSASRYHRSPDAKPGEKLALKANATWLVCEKICVPEEGTFALDIPIAASSGRRYGAE